MTDADADVASSSSSPSSPSPSPRTPRARPRRRARDDDESTRVDRVVLGGITAVGTAIGGITAGCGVARAHRFEDSKTIKNKKKQKCGWGCVPLHYVGAAKFRSRYLAHAKRALYQLSYSPAQYDE